MSYKDFQLYTSLGSLIKDYRQWRGLSQETLAKSIRVSARELRRWETDHCRARIENLHDLSEITGSAGFSSVRTFTLLWGHHAEY